MKPLYAAGLTLAALLATPASASVIFKFEPTEVTRFDDVEGTIIISDEAYHAGKLRWWPRNFYGPGTVYDGEARYVSEIMPEGLELFEIHLSSEEGPSGGTTYTQGQYEYIYMDNAFLFDLEVATYPIADEAGNTIEPGDAIIGSFHSNYAMSEQIWGSLSHFEWGADGYCDYIERPCAEARGIWRRVSGPDTPAPVPEPATAVLVLAGLIGAAWLRPSRGPS